MKILTRPPHTKSKRTFVLLQLHRFALGGEEDSFLSALGPLLGVLLIVIDQGSILADIINLLAIAHDADELFGGQFGDILLKPLNLALLRFFVCRLGQDVAGNLFGDHFPEGLHVLFKRRQSSHCFALHRNSPVSSIHRVKVREHSVHVPVVSHLIALPDLLYMLIIPGGRACQHLF